jgi:hypothetical protein
VRNRLKFNHRVGCLAFVLIGLLPSACGGGGGGTSTSPTQAAQVAGNWSVSETLTSATGGDCVGLVAAQAIGVSFPSEYQLGQTGADLTALYNDGDIVCTLSGTAGAESFTLNASACQVSDVAVRCANGLTREVRYGSFRVNATVVSRDRFTGIATQSWNVTTTTGEALPPMVLVVTFTAVKR